IAVDRVTVRRNQVPVRGKYQRQRSAQVLVLKNDMAGSRGPIGCAGTRNRKDRVVSGRCNIKSIGVGIVGQSSGSKNECRGIALDRVSVGDYGRASNSDPSR